MFPFQSKQDLLEHWAAQDGSSSKLPFKHLTFTWLLAKALVKIRKIWLLITNWYYMSKTDLAIGFFKIQFQILIGIVLQLVLHIK